VGNAVDYATAGTPILIHAREEAEAPLVEITNHGIAISPEELPQIFTAFRRGEAAASPSGHLGLGLYIASEIVRAHGGTLEVRSREGTTSFTLQLPRG
jgi:signal transduction histidine kinase